MRKTIISIFLGLMLTHGLTSCDRYETIDDCVVLSVKHVNAFYQHKTIDGRSGKRGLRTPTLVYQPEYWSVMADYGNGVVLPIRLDYPVQEGDTIYFPVKRRIRH